MSTSRLQLAAALAASLFVAACAGLLGGGDKATLYRIGSGAVPPPREASGRIPIVVARPELPAGAEGDRILTVTGREAAYLAEARWVSPTPQMIREALAAAIARNVPSAYVPNGGTGSAHFVLTTRFTVFAAFYETGPDAAPLVRLVAQSELRRAGESEPLAIRVHAAEQQAAENRVSAVVDAFDAASLQLADDVARWLGEEIGGR